MEFEKSIFINCPYDKDYDLILKLLIFTIMLPGLEPRLASENSDCTIVRLHLIKEIIHSCKYSIHDLSRVKSKKDDEYFRMNMPFELGLDFGCKEFSTDIRQNSKKFLVLEQNRYDYQKALSDFAGIDIVAHSGDPIKVIKSVTKWLKDSIPGLKFPGPTAIWNWYHADFMEFMKDEADSSQQTENEIFDCSTYELKSYINTFFQDFKEIEQYRIFN